MPFLPMDTSQLRYQWPGERIDKWLTTQFPYTRNFFHHIISRGGILIRDKAIKKSYVLKPGDLVTIDDLSRYLSPALLDEAPAIAIPVVLEKEDYLIINKPKGVLSHPNSIRDIAQPSVVWFLYHTYKDLPTIGHFIRAWLLHRLDKDTDWLMIIAKTEKWLAYFKWLFQERSEKGEDYTWWLEKYYRATCHVTLLWEVFLEEISTKLPFVIKEMVVPKVPHYISKMWITKIISVEHIDDAHVRLVLQILTWRTHQIRYHLSQHGLPIVWDYLYGNPEPTEAMQLTAYKLVFPDMDGQQIILEI